MVGPANGAQAKASLERWLAAIVPPNSDDSAHGRERVVEDDVLLKHLDA